MSDQTAQAPPPPEQSDLGKALEEPNVVHSLVQAWRSTVANNVEYGGWIYRNDAMGGQNKYSVRTKTDNQNSSIVLTNTNDLAWFRQRNCVILADFHCHPGNQVSAGKPSQADISGARGLTYTRLVFTPDTDHVYDIRPLAAPTPKGFPDGAIMWIIT